MSFMIRILYRCSDLSRPQSAEQVHAWIARNLPDRPHPEIYRPINWIRIIALTTTVLGTITFLSVAWPYLLPIIQNRNVWAAISLIAILLFTSGHMFNHIRKVPYVAGDGRGGISYFAGGFSNQFGLETQIIGAICKSLPSVWSAPMLTYSLRWPFVLCHNHFGTQSSTHSKSESPTSFSYRLGRCSLHDVQLPNERIQDQEQRIPFLAPSFLLDLYLKW